MLNFGFRYLLCGGCQKFNRFTEEVCASLFANHITIYPWYELSACHCSAHTHSCIHTHFLSLFSAASCSLQSESQHSAGAHTHIPWINSEWASEQLVHSAPGYLARTGERVNVLREKEIAAAVSLHMPRPYRRQGDGAREWPPVTALWAARRWPLSLALRGCLRPLSPFRKSSLFMWWGTVFQSGSSTEHGEWWHQGSKPWSLFLILIRGRSIQAEEGGMKAYWSEGC